MCECRIWDTFTSSLTFQRLTEGTVLINLIWNRDWQFVYFCNMKRSLPFHTNTGHQNCLTNIGRSVTEKFGNAKKHTMHARNSSSPRNYYMQILQETFCLILHLLFDVSVPRFVQLPRCKLCHHASKESIKAKPSHFYLNKLYLLRMNQSVLFCFFRAWRSVCQQLQALGSPLGFPTSSLHFSDTVETFYSDPGSNWSTLPPCLEMELIIMTNPLALRRWVVSTFSCTWELLYWRPGVMLFPDPTNAKPTFPECRLPDPIRWIPELLNPYFVVVQWNRIASITAEILL